MISFDESRSATQADVVVALNSFIGDYELYNDANKVKKYTEMLIKQLSSCKNTLKETI